MYSFENYQDAIISKFLYEETFFRFNSFILLKILNFLSKFFMRKTFVHTFYMNSLVQYSHFIISFSFLLRLNTSRLEKWNLSSIINNSFYSLEFILWLVSDKSFLNTWYSSLFLFLFRQGQIPIFLLKNINFINLKFKSK